MPGLHVEPGEGQGRVRAGRLVEGAHPFDHVAHFFRVPGPEIHAGKRSLCVAFPGLDVAVHGQRFGPVGFDRKHREALLLYQVFEQAMLHLEKLARAMRRFAQRHETRIPYGLAEYGQVVHLGAGHHGGERRGALLQLRHHCLDGLGIGFQNNRVHGDLERFLHSPAGRRPGPGPGSGGCAGRTDPAPPG